MSDDTIRRGLIRPAVDGARPIEPIRPKDAPEIAKFSQQVAELINNTLSDQAPTADRVVRMRDLFNMGLVEIRDPSDGRFVRGSGAAPRDVRLADAVLSGSSTSGSPSPSIPGPPGPPGPPAPPPPPPPAPTVPTNLAANAALTSIILTWDAQDFAVVAYVEVWASGTNSLATATKIGNAYTNVYSDAVGATGVLKWYWIRSVGFGGDFSAYNATNGTPAQTGKIGNVDLGPLIIEAGNIAAGAVIADKIANASLTFAKFASGIAPIGVYTGLPNPAGYTGPSVIFNTVDGKLYRLVSGAWVASVLAADISGQLQAAQLAAIEASKITGQLTDAQIASLTAAKLTGQITETQITNGAISTPKLAAGAVLAGNLAADSVIAGKIAADAVTAREIQAGSITTAKIQAGAITTGTMAANSILGDRIQANSLDASKITANSITAGQIQAGAIGTNELAANSIVASKLLITPGNLVSDPFFLDAAAWVNEGWLIETVLNGNAANGPTRLNVRGCVTLWDGAYTGTVRRHVYRDIENLAMAGDTLRLRAKGRNQANQAIYSNVSIYDASWAFLAGAQVSWGPGDAAQYKSAQVTVPANARYFRVWAAFQQGEGTAWSGIAEIGDIRVDVASGADLIVDGAITATKIAAGAIAVGTAAIQNGAIVNAMIANAAIDDAKISNLDAAKITTGFLNAARIQTGSIDSRIAQITDAQIQTVSAGKITSTYLSSINANLGFITAGTIDLNQGGAGSWSYVRTASKWLDSNNGFVIAGYQPDSSYFFDFKTGNNQIRMTGGPSAGGATAFINFNNKFQVDVNGNLTAQDANLTNAYVRGNVEATSLNASTAAIVDTINLTGEAVTIPRVLLLSPPGRAVGFNTYVNLVETGTLSASNGMVFLSFTIEAAHAAVSTGSGDTGYTNTVRDVSLQLLRNGSTVNSWTLPGELTQNSAFPISSPQYKFHTISFADRLEGAFSVNYVLRIVRLDSGDQVSGARRVDGFALGLKMGGGSSPPNIPPLPPTT